MATVDRIKLAPHLGASGKAGQSFCEFAAELSACDVGHVDTLRDAWLQRISASAPEGQALRVCISILADLKAQGWDVGFDGESASVVQPSPESNQAATQKERVKRGHLRERDYQLTQTSVRQFVAEMERPRLTKAGWVSIFSVMRDGRELAAKLREAAAITDPDARIACLDECIDPYVQPIEADQTCEETGLPLTDIWRYFRHTWTTHYNSTPGRQVLFLIRDRAVANHPVIGIGAYGSAVVQLAVRDDWIGWTKKTFLRRLKDEPGKFGPWILESLEELIGEIYTKDFIAEGILDRRLLNRPDDATIDRLNHEAVEAFRLHRANPEASLHKAATNRGDDWLAEALTPLFRGKRARALAQLLAARAALNRVGFTAEHSIDVERVVADARALHAVHAIRRHVKATHVGVDMVDITVCGSVAPYGPILGGKLVSLLMASPTATSEYERRYKDAVSIIASSMAGKAVVRRPRLVLLGTTSLYGTSSSQYNRLRVPASVLGGQDGAVLEYKELGHSIGFGSFHFLSKTLDEIEVLLAQGRDGRPVNSIFGEGVNPKLRKIRAGLDAIGFPADVMLKHGDSRLVYGVTLARNFRDVLLGLSRRRDPIIPASGESQSSRALVHFWKQRWLAPRIGRDGVLEQVAAHTLVHPVTHGARVRLPELLHDETGQQTLVFGE